MFLTLNAFAVVALIFGLIPTIAWVIFFPKVIRTSLESGSIGLAIVFTSSYILVPLASWYQGRENADAKMHEIQMQIGALPVKELMGSPPEFIATRGRVALSEGSLSGLSCPKPKPKVTYGIIKQYSQKELAEMENEHRRRIAADAKRPRPNRYLILEADDAPPVPTNASPVAGGATRRLYLISNGQETLIGVHFIPYFAKPYDVPILTLSGWYEKPNVVNAQNDHLIEFLRSALHVKCIDLHIL